MATLKHNSSIKTNIIDLLSPGGCLARCASEPSWRVLGEELHGARKMRSELIILFNNNNIYIIAGLSVWCIIREADREFEVLNWRFVSRTSYTSRVGGLPFKRQTDAVMRMIWTFLSFWLTVNSTISTVLNKNISSSQRLWSQLAKLPY